MSKNLKLWEMVEKTNPKNTKEFKGKGGFRGTAVCAQTQRKQATEVFGPFGIGWKLLNESYTIVKLTDDPKESILVYSGDLNYTFEGEIGVVRLCSEIDIWNYSIKYKSWSKNNDIHKKVRTDAITKGLSELGFNSDIFMGLYDDNKYVSELRKEFSATPPVPEKASNKDKLKAELVALVDTYEIPKKDVKDFVKLKFDIDLKNLEVLTESQLQATIDECNKRANIKKEA